jgi:hypothetical protein
MSRDLLRQALKAIYASHEYTVFDKDFPKEFKPVVEAIEAELAKPETPEDLLRQSEREGWRYAKELEQELAKPEQTIVPFPSFMRKRIEEAIDNAINPKGMSVHDGKATVYASDLQRMIAVIDLAPPRKEWIGLTDDERNRYRSYTAENFGAGVLWAETKLWERNK